MFTIKYRAYNRDEREPGTFWNNEQLHGPYDFVSREIKDGLPVVYGHVGDGLPMTFGPEPLPGVAGEGQLRPTVWVMNEHGATVAKYDL